MTVVSQVLRHFIENIERLEHEKADIQSQISEVKKQARFKGFDIKTINKILKERNLTAQQIVEEQALLELYRAALGMLHDTPLGEAARRQLSPPEPEQEEKETESETEILPDDIEEARSKGAQAAKDGKHVTENPYPARDPRRAAWDEAWCAAIGSDGMEIPEAFRRKKSEPKPTEEPKEQPVVKKPKKPKKK